jgi:hypothetical protein
VLYQLAAGADLSIYFEEEAMATNQSVVKQENVQARNLMVFILVMALSGLANLLAEIVPTLQVGPVEIGISVFWFVPLTLVILFHGWWAALAVPVGELVFSDLVLGEFGGLGELEEVILVTVALFLACRLVSDPKNRKLIMIAGLLAYLFAELPAAFVDMLKVWVGVEEFEAVEGLPESVFALEMIDFAVEYIITGIVFGLLPTLWLAPRLHGRIEPLMGIKARSPEDPHKVETSNRLLIYGIVGVVVAAVIALLAESGVSIVEWEPEFLDTIGDWFIWVAIGISAVVSAVVLFLQSRSSEA